MKLTYLLKAPLCMLLAGEVSADESQWGLGIGAMADKQGYAGVNTKTTVIPITSYESENFSINGPQFEYTLGKYTIPDFGALKLSLLGQYRFDGYEAEDGDIFNGMDKRSGAFELGFSVGYSSNLGGISFEFVNDVTNKHEGYEASLTYSRPYFFDSVIIEPYAKISHFSDNFVNYYYGVEDHESLSNRQAYVGEDTVNGEIGLRMRWQAGKHHSFISNLSYRSFGSDIKNSPLVSGSGGANIILGYVYAF
ncbi:MipA/OmpV family protein [Pseudoalteromonas denitrificans]|uniref:Outer membrane protein n=1 Tax=Pseudoalteromonas denitrificans DSM 6059 TaxID=1123010 RepID=A0A1I1NU75_9GAMM|nr:MipA/OmpV family protein [Pseudoalteromonas denitrificans]SFC99058.1 outer membrane protein [Pseudoalteromonas denitrificans DSM 6059]